MKKSTVRLLARSARPVCIAPLALYASLARPPTQATF